MRCCYQIVPISHLLFFKEKRIVCECEKYIMGNNVQARAFWRNGSYAPDWLSEIAKRPEQIILMSTEWSRITVGLLRMKRRIARHQVNTLSVTNPYVAFTNRSHMARKTDILTIFICSPADPLLIWYHDHFHKPYGCQCIEEAAPLSLGVFIRP